MYEMPDGNETGGASRPMISRARATHREEEREADDDDENGKTEEELSDIFRTLRHLPHADDAIFDHEQPAILAHMIATE